MRLCEDRIDNHRMPGGEDAVCLVGKRRVDANRYFIGVPIGGQLFRFANAEQGLALHVRAHDDGARHRL